MKNNKRKKERAVKKVQIAIDKLIDIIEDLYINESVSQSTGEILDRLRELESKIEAS